MITCAPSGRSAALAAWAARVDGPGAVPLGLVVAFVFYVLARSAATAFQNNRRQRMKRRPERLTDTGAGA